ncbi:MAG: efflux RND transporter periplasmic adaptor subunit [Thermotogae bacterium]|nr:efflux RND transporter periplasmic adaptor subunit [Thermotogota bacterium]
MLRRYVPIFGILILGCSQNDKTETVVAEEMLRTVEVTVLKPSTIERKITLIGDLRGENEVLVFPDAPGKLFKLKVKDGQYVKKGEIVALLDRSAPGYDIPPMTVIAPASGYVQLLVKDMGTSVGKDKPIMRIISTRRFKVSVGIPEVYAENVRKRPILTMDGRRVKIASIPPALDQRTHMLRLEGYVSGNYLPGQSVDVDVVVARKDSTRVLPISALVGGVKKGVFVIKGGVARYVPVKLGLRTSTKVEILKGLEFGDTVVVFGAASLKDGQRVKLRFRD